MATPDRKPLSFFSLLVDHRPALTSPIVDPSFIMRKSTARMIVKRIKISYPFFGEEIKLVYSLLYAFVFLLLTSWSKQASNQRQLKIVHVSSRTDFSRSLQQLHHATKNYKAKLLSTEAWLPVPWPATVLELLRSR